MINWKKLNQDFLNQNKTNELLRNKKYYEPIIIKEDDQIVVKASRLINPNLDFGSRIGFDIFSKDEKRISPPNFIERLLKISFNDKVQKAVRRVEAYCNKKNLKIYQVENFYL